MSLLYAALLISLGLYFFFIMLFFYGLRRHKISEPVEVDWPSVAIVVAARNESNNIRNLLEDFTRLDYPQDKLNIVIADDRSTDDTWSVISAFSAQWPQIRGIQIQEKSPRMTPKKHALTQAIHASKSEYILTTDADCQVPPGWVQSMVNELLTGQGIVIGSSQIDTPPGNIFAQYQLIDFLALVSANAGAAGWGWAWAGTGSNLAYTRSAFKVVNGFEPVRQQVSGDDIYLVQSIAKHHPFVFNKDPRSFVKTKPVKSIRYFFNQRIRWSSNSRMAARAVPVFLLFLLNAFLVNTLLLAGLFTSDFRNLLPMVFSIKFISDALVIFSGANMLQISFSPLIFILWSLVQPFYIPVVGLGGLIGKFTWKK